MDPGPFSFHDNSSSSKSIISDGNLQYNLAMDCEYDYSSDSDDKAAPQYSC